MNKTELGALVAEKLGVSKKDGAKSLDAVLSAIQDTVAGGDKVIIPGFGTFETREREAHTGRNPFNGETIEIAASKVPTFKFGKSFKDAVKKA
ncbi:MAG: HU family DNA-binding protein [Clostridia bacterium]|nr:HU family DNA-binding protein [Clostridia bacterium]